jgi:hypothetical protein
VRSSIASPSAAIPRARLLAIPVLVFLATLAIRVHGISDHFWLLEDQIRDWGIALRPFTDLPLVGSPTHVGGYTIGPAFYWILWLIRVIVGPWFHDLPHAGGIGQAAVESAADALLLVAIWKRTGSMWVGLTTVTALATASFPLSLAAVVWNPVMGAALAEIATALVLLDWPRGSWLRTGFVAAIAWCGVHAYTGAIFVAIAILAALLVQAARDGGRRGLWKFAAAIGVAVVLLQVPYLVHEMRQGFGSSGMDAVTGSAGAILSGAQPIRLGVSFSSYAGALSFNQGLPWTWRPLVWVVIACGGLVLVARRRDPVLLTVILLPQIAAVAGYSLWLGTFDAYYYFSLMPAAVLTILLAIDAVLPHRAGRLAAIAMFVGVLALVPARLKAASTMFRMPEYAALVSGSRAIVSMGQPMRDVETAFALPPTSDATFIYQILGGRLDPHSTWVAVIQPDGRVEYRHATAR